MSYKLSLKRLPNFLRYVNKVYRFSRTIDSMQGNSDRDVSPQTIFMSSFLIVSGEKVYTNQETFLCMSTLPVEMADADTVRQIVHAKWGVENNAIKDLKDNWYMEHSFHHHPNATPAFARAGSMRCC